MLFISINANLVIVFLNFFFSVGCWTKLNNLAPVITALQRIFVCLLVSLFLQKEASKEQKVSKEEVAIGFEWGWKSG